MLTDVLVALGFVAVWLLLAPCSPFSIWKGAACAWKPKSPPPDDAPKPPESP